MERRKDDGNITVLINMVQSNIESIAKLDAKLTKHIEEEKPLMDVMHDVAAVGRLGRVLKHVVIGFTIVGGAFAASWEYINHIWDKP